MQVLVAKLGKGKHMNQNLEQNKQNAIAFYRMAYEGEPRKAV